MKFKKTLAGLGATLVLGGGGIYGADQAVNPYEDLGDKYKLEIVSDIPQGERVEIHKDKAQMDLVFWNDEQTISIIPQIPTANLGANKVDNSFKVEADRPLLSKKMEYKSGDVTAFIEPKEDTENEFDIDFTLQSKPNTNVFTYKIEGAEEFDFWYQSSLSPEESIDGQDRPENVIGSYAVYHKTKKDHRIGQTNYATGKAFHIYRPKAIDANGVEVWAELSYSEGVLTVTVPEKWLETAAYPVLVDPTFGYTSVGATQTSNLCTTTSDLSQTLGYATSLTEEGTLVSLHAAPVSSDADTENVDLAVAIYREDSVATDQHGLVTLAETLNVSISSAAFIEISATAVALSVDTYVLAAICNGADLVDNNINLAHDSSGSRNIYSEGTTGASSYATRKAENPWTEVKATSATLRSIYATYTASASEGPSSPSSLYIKNGGLYVKDGGLYIKK